VDEVVVVDLDGTLADNRHRLSHIENEDKQWGKYLSKVQKDKPVQEVISKINDLSETHKIVILTMRSDQTEEDTLKWLRKNDVSFDELIMLPEGHWNVKDCEFKERKLKNMENPVIAFDDKERNCQMYKEKGLETYLVELKAEQKIKKY